MVMLSSGNLNNMMMLCTQKTFSLFLIVFFLVISFSFVHAEDIILELDITSPIITLIGDSQISITLGDTYIDEGAIAIDETDGDITANIIVSNPVDTAIPGEYTISYSVNDSAGNSATEVERLVTVAPLVPVLDITPPVITLLGDAIVFLAEGETYVDAGATALDDIDGDITANIIISNPVDTTIPGEYTVTYTVSDLASNNAIVVTRTVMVMALLPQPVPIPMETVVIRNGDTVLFQDVVELPVEGALEVTDSEGVIHTVSTQSVLGFLYALDEISDAFSISDIQYYSSFDSLYIKCITPQNGDPLCDNWQYVVDNVTPWSAVDATFLSGAEAVGLYFGYSHQVSLPETEIIAGVPFTVTAEKYNYENNTWNPLSEVTIGVTTPNPDDPWNPIVVATQAVDTEGKATFTLTDAGTYSVGIAEDYYFPAYTVTVSQDSGDDSHEDEDQEITFSVSAAMSYLESVQNSNGSFGDAMYTDWAAFAIVAAGGSSTTKVKLIHYMEENSFLSSFLTDNERKSMALLALKQNPYDFAGENYIEAIISEFDGTQFGDDDLVNDDIFALIPLASSGYSNEDEIIYQDVAFIISEQKGNGSWENSIDLTAAAIQALDSFSSLDGVSDSIAQAGVYLENMQKNDGGWGSVYGTSWVLQSESVLGASWIKNGNSGLDYLVHAQVADGAVLDLTESLQNRIWATSYAIPAALGKSWNSILYNVKKPKEEKVDDNEEEIVVDDIPQEDETQETDIPIEENKEIKSNILNALVSEKNIVSANFLPIEDIAFPIQDTQNNVDTLVAMAGESKTHIPIVVVIVGIIILAGGIVVRFVKFFR